MSRNTTLFMALAVPVLAGLLAILGWMTLPENLLGWFLLLTGMVYLFGVIYTFWVRRPSAVGPQPVTQAAQQEQGDRSFWLILPGMIACFFVSPVEYLYGPALLPRTTTMQAAGLALVAAGVVLFVWARRTLRAAYLGHLSVTGAQALVQTGPYRVVRHPAYLGFILMALGVSLGYGSLLGLAAVPVLLLPGLAYRIRVEERLLEAHFAAQYRQYAARTARLLPGVW